MSGRAKSMWKEEIGKIIEELRREPLSTRELTKRVVGEDYSDSARRRISRHLELLDMWKLVERRKGRLHWYEYTLYSSRGGYERYLDHSKKLIEENRGSSPAVLTPGFIHEPLLEHLRTGYPQTHKLIQEVEKLQKEKEKAMKHLNDLIKEKIRGADLTPRGVGSEKEGTVSYTQIKKMLLAREENHLESGFEDIVVDKEGNILHRYLRGRFISPKGGSLLLERIKKVMREVAENGKIKRKVREYNKKRDEWNRKQSDLDKHYSYLEKKVEHGEPFKGSCSLCPKVKVGGDEGEGG